MLRVADWDCHGVVQLFCTNTKHGSNAGESFQNEAWSPDLQPVRDGMLILACLCGYGQAPFEGPTQYCSPHCQPWKYHPELVCFWEKLFLVTCSYLRNFRFGTTIRGLHYTYQGAFTIGPYHKKEWHLGAFISDVAHHVCCERLCKHQSQVLTSQMIGSRFKNNLAILA